MAEEDVSFFPLGVGFYESVVLYFLELLYLGLDDGVGSEGVECFGCDLGLYFGASSIYLLLISDVGFGFEDLSSEYVGYFLLGGGVVGEVVGGGPDEFVGEFVAGAVVG